MYPAPPHPSNTLFRQVGVSSRLTILGDSPGATVTYSRPATGNADWRRPDAAGGSGDEDDVGALFQVEKDATLVVENLSVLNDSGGGPALLLFGLLPESLVEARGCYFGPAGGGGSASPAIAHVAKSSRLHLADGCSVVLRDSSSTSAGGGEPARNNNGGGWLAAAVVVESGGEFLAESMAFRRIAATTTRPPETKAVEENAATHNVRGTSNYGSALTLLRLLGGTATLVDCEFSEGSFAGGASGRDAAWVESRMLLLRWAGAAPLLSGGRVEAHQAKGAVTAVAPTSSTENQHWSGTTSTTTTPAVDDEELDAPLLFSTSWSVFDGRLLLPPPPPPPPNGAPPMRSRSPPGSVESHRSVWVSGDGSQLWVHSTGGGTAGAVVDGNALREADDFAGGDDNLLQALQQQQRRWWWWPVGTRDFLALQERLFGVLRLGASSEATGSAGKGRGLRGGETVVASPPASAGGGSGVAGEAGGEDEDHEMAIAPAGGLGRRGLLVECPEGYFGDCEYIA